MAPNATAGRPARLPAAKQPPENSVWVRYHPWIEGVMGHVTSLSLHLLVVGGAFLWFTYIAFALGFAHAPRSLPVEPVRFDNAGGGGNKEGSGTEKGGDHAPLKEGAEADKDNPGDKKSPLDASDRPQLTDVQAKKIDQTFAPDDARYIKQNVGSMQSFAALDKDLRDKLRDGINPSKGNGGTGTGGGTGAGTGTGTGSGTGAGTERKLNEREKRFLRWSLLFRTRGGAAGELRNLKTLGIVLGIPNGPDSIVTIDLAKRPFRPEVKDPSTIGKVYYKVTPESSEITPHDLMEAMGLPAPPNLIMLLFIPTELEDDIAKLELGYKHLPENDILETEIEIRVPGAGGRKYDLRVVEQKKK
jgi:hypothetical protein